MGLWVSFGVTVVHKQVRKAAVNMGSREKPFSIYSNRRSHMLTLAGCFRQFDDMHAFAKYRQSRVSRVEHSLEYSLFLKTTG